jgi:DNA-binding transcriptional LysR family regulator
LILDLTLGDQDDPLRDVRRDGTDLTLLIGPGADRRPGIRMVRLLEDAYLAVLPEGHELASKRVLDLADLADQPWVGSEPPGPCLDTVVDACAAAGFSPHVVARSEDYTTAQHFVAAGLGVTLIPRLGLSTHLPGLAIRTVRNPEPVRTVFAAVRESSLAQPAVRTLMEALTRPQLPLVPRTP